MNKVEIVPPMSNREFLQKYEAGPRRAGRRRQPD